MKLQVHTAAGDIAVEADCGLVRVNGLDVLPHEAQQFARALALAADRANDRASTAVDDFTREANQA